MLGVCDETLSTATRTNSSAANKSSESSTARRGLLYLLVPFDFQCTLDAAIAVGRWTLRLEERSDLLWNRHGLIVPRLAFTNFGVGTRTCRFAIASQGRG